MRGRNIGLLVGRTTNWLLIGMLIVVCSMGDVEGSRLVQWKSADNSLVMWEIEQRKPFGEDVWEPHTPRYWYPDWCKKVLVLGANTFMCDLWEVGAETRLRWREVRAGGAGVWVEEAIYICTYPVDGRQLTAGCPAWQGVCEPLPSYLCPARPPGMPIANDACGSGGCACHGPDDCN